MLSMEYKLEALRLANEFEAGPQETVERARAYLDFLSSDAPTATAPASEPAKPSAQPASTATGGDEGKAPAGTVATQAGSTETQSSAPADANTATDTYNGDVKTLQAKCQALGQRDGPQALLAAFQKLGAGRWSEVPVEKHAQLYADLVAAGV